MIEFFFTMFVASLPILVGMGASLMVMEYLIWRPYRKWLLEVVSQRVTASEESIEAMEKNNLAIQKLCEEIRTMTTAVYTMRNP